MKAIISRGLRSRCVRPPKGRGILTPYLSARTGLRKHHNRGRGNARRSDFRADGIGKVAGSGAAGGRAWGRGRIRGFDAGVPGALGAALGGEVVSADSMQVYRGLPILTNQPERPTRLVGIWELDRSTSVGEYQPLAHSAVDEILGAGQIPILAGGTGLYLRAALAELRLPPPAS